MSNREAAIEELLLRAEDAVVTMSAISGLADAGVIRLQLDMRRLLQQRDIDLRRAIGRVKDAK